MYFLNLSLAEPLRTQSIYHMLAREGIESLIITSPLHPYVCIGYFQDILETVNLEYCHKNKIPVYRREVGGGSVLLDQHQVFYQVVLKRSNSVLPSTVESIYKKFSQPPIETYRELGISVRHRPVNDLVNIEGKKISGQGGANIENCVVFVGSIILDFDFQLMVDVLNIPDEKFKDKLYNTMQDNMSTVKKELGFLPRRDDVTAILKRKFEEFFGIDYFEPLILNQELNKKLKSVERFLASEGFIYNPRGKQVLSRKSVKITEGLYLGESTFKLPGGLIRTIVEWQNDVIISVTIYGDFTLQPKESISIIEKCLQGAGFNYEEVSERLIDCFLDDEIDIPGCPPEEIAHGILKAKEQ